MIRVGFGQDSHRFLKEGEQKLLILGGVHIPGFAGLLGHSDADVIYHALFNALSGAVGGESIGYYFSDSAPENKDRSSADFLRKARELVSERRCQIVNVDIMVEAKEPKLQALVPKMKKNIAELLEIGVEQIALKATSGEGLTAFGRGEGIQVQAVAVVQKVLP